MADLLLPPKVRREIQKRKWAEQRAAFRATLNRLLDFDDPVCREWTPVLRNLDPLLRLGRAHGQAYEPGMNVKPGYYHMVRDNETAAPTVEPVTGPDGESFAYPDSRLLEELRAVDLQNPRVYAALIARRELREQQREQEHARDMDEINSESVERWLAATRTQVLMSPDVAWAQNSAGRRAIQNQTDSDDQ